MMAVESGNKRGVVAEAPDDSRFKFFLPSLIILIKLSASNTGYSHTDTGLHYCNFLYSFMSAVCLFQATSY